jgi:hypothetical protein
MRTCDAIRTDATFVAFVGFWERERRCPLEFADYLRDYGYDDHADATVYASEQKRRYIKDCTACGLYPDTCVNGTWLWYIRDKGTVFIDLPENDDLFYCKFPGVTIYDNIIRRPTFLDATIFVLDYLATWLKSL